MRVDVSTATTALSLAYIQARAISGAESPSATKVAERLRGALIAACMRADRYRGDPDVYYEEHYDRVEDLWDECVA